jgi:hypothetical protein
LKNSWDELREEKAVLIQQQRLQHAPRWGYLFKYK